MTLKMPALRKHFGMLMLKLKANDLLAVIFHILLRSKDLATTNRYYAKQPRFTV